MSSFVLFDSLGVAKKCGKHSHYFFLHLQRGGGAQGGRGQGPKSAGQKRGIDFYFKS